VDTNLVTVPVVVRGQDGKPVANLEKRNFHLFDNGTPQEITGFKVETAGSRAARAGKPSPVTAESSAVAPMPQRFVGLFFDDFHMSTEDVARTRNAAWRYLSNALRPEDRIAIFTSSAKEQLDFTSDRDKLHETLFRVAPHSRTIPLLNQCPAIGEYQAYMIDHLQDTGALEIATAEGYECHCQNEGNQSALCRDDQLRQARFDAAQIWGLADLQSQYALEAIQLVVRRLAAMPGQRAVVLISPGFLTSTRNNDVDALINRALGQNVVISAIDAAGLYTRNTRPRLSGARLDLDAQKTLIENAALNIQRDALAGLSHGTGGVFFQNSNDFDEGFREAAEVPAVSYLLSFSPQNVKLDGTFHTLKVTVETEERARVEARRGYVAPKPSEQESAPTQTELEKAVFSLDELHGLPVEVQAQMETSGEKATVTVRIHVDIRSLHFRKEVDRAIDTLVFETALFDQDGKYVTAKEASLDLRLKDANLDKFATSGINAVTKFQVPPGSYRVREVVHDAESKELAAINCNVRMPR
jgi:VWFA-related protein